MCLLGDHAVGKTSLIKRYVQDEFSDEYISTIGTKVTKKEIVLNFEEPQVQVHLMFMIWDVVGQQEFRMFHKMYIRGVEGALLVADMTRRQTLDTVKKLDLMVKEQAGEVPTLILINKSDLVAQAQINPEEMKRMETYKKTPIVLTSAKTGNNVEYAFYTLGVMMAEKFLGTNV